MPEKPFVSVIICSKNRHALLQKAAASVLASDYPGGRFELVVVEECSEPQPVPGAKYVHLPVRNLGLGYCHNAGVRNANGEIIVFTDDDVVVETAWLGELVSCFDDPAVYGAAGLVRTQRGSASGETEEILGLPGGGLKALAASGGKTVPTGSLSTCNAAYRRPVFSEFSFLETSFGKYGGDDWYLGKQVSEKYRAVFNPRAVVYHRPKASVGRLVHTYYRRQLTDYLARKDLRGQSKAAAIFGKGLQCVIFRAAAFALAFMFFGLPGALFMCAAYYAASLASIIGLWRFIENKRAFLLYPWVKAVTELGILKGELLILFSSGAGFDKILERY